MFEQTYGRNISEKKKNRALTNDFVWKSVANNNNNNIHYKTFYVNSDHLDTFRQVKKSDHIVQVNLVNFGADAMRFEISKVRRGALGMADPKQHWLTVELQALKKQIKRTFKIKAVDN